MSKNRVKVAAQNVRTREEMEALVGKIALLKNREREIKSVMDAEIIEVKSRYEESLGPVRSALEVGMECAREWANAHPEEFGKSKSIDMTQAVIGFRTGQPQLKTLRGWTWDRILEKLSLTALGQVFIRVKKEVDKQALMRAMGDDEEQLRAHGLRLAQEETFYVDPKLSETEKRETVDVSESMA
jgi:phage host-nuclease inhibitor protein Gam